jgi:2-polyprenyl-6-hydroxyphenyl methylase/3-demethylubiquinone-9 3-methyltransferase
MTDTVRYDFGRNWSDFYNSMDPDARLWARAELARLAGDISGLRVLDIGCGSGLHALAALDLGASFVTAFDYDPLSVATAKQLLETYARGAKWTVDQGDILNVKLAQKEKSDIVYSWGVLHHTGDLWAALQKASELVDDEGRFIVALYKKTPLCSFWRMEKRIYARHRSARPIVYWLYCTLFTGGLVSSGRNPLAYIRDYKRSRGMSFWQNVDDWLGGYPYESVVPAELENFMEQRGFVKERSYNTRGTLGVAGTGCAEWVFRSVGQVARKQQDSAAIAH